MLTVFTFLTFAMFDILDIFYILQLTFDIVYIVRHFWDLTKSTIVLLFDLQRDKQQALCAHVHLPIGFLC